MSQNPKIPGRAQPQPTASASGPQAEPEYGRFSVSPRSSGTGDAPAGRNQLPAVANQFLRGEAAVPRCGEKGCVFPATGPGMQKCLVHDLEEREPKHFGSFQPTMLLLDRAKYGPPDPDYVDTRARDRHRQVAQREQFLEDVA